MKMDLFGQPYDPSGAPLTQERLKEILHYDPETGEWRWLITKGSKVVAGQIGGYIHEHGYRHIRINNVAYKSSRLAWLYMTGQWPERTVDHKDTYQSNDKWTNLRLANNSQQMWNMGLSRRNTSGYKRVYPDKRTGRWYSSIYDDDKRIFLGSFSTAAKAHEAYKKAAIKYYGEFANFGALPQLKGPDLFA